MTTEELLSQLRRLDVRLWASGGRLHYSAAKGVLTEALKTALSERKAEILAFLQSATAVADGSRLPSIDRVARDQPLPLSYAQQRLWFLDRLMPGSSFYNFPAAIRLSLPLNISMLKRAIDEIVRRHEALRTSFTMADGQPVQVIAPSLGLELPLEDLRHHDSTRREAEARQLVADESQRPFDLTTGPLVRIKLLQLDEQDYVFLLTMHHIVCDGWSIGIFFRELNSLYAGFCLGRPSLLPELPVQYADFAVWQRNWLHGEALESQLAYWKERMEDLPVLQLPTDYPRPAVPSFRGAQQSLTIPVDLHSALQELSQQEDCTLFMTLLAVFQVLLHRYTGQDEIVVGSPTANRNRAEIEGLIGFFVNFLVLRTDLSGNPSFRQVLARVREVALGAYARQDLPFEKLVEELQPERDLSRNPLFQVTFQLFARASREEFSDTGIFSVDEAGSAKFDLRFDLWETAEGIRGRFEYSLDLFAPETIERMAGHFQTLLEGIVANPDQRLSELPLLTKTEEQQMLVDWNATAQNHGDSRCIHQVFEVWAERRPDAIALVCGNQQLTYRELNNRANQLAHHLRGRGVRPEVFVGICMERSLEMIVGLLGVWKAGGVYVPLDSTYPKERLAFMIEDARVPVLLTQKRLRDRFTKQDCQILCLDTDWEAVARESVESVPNQGVATPDNLAYVIYTSGSTGKPKGVLIEHRSLRNTAEAQFCALQVQPEDRILQFCSLSFDGSIFEMIMFLRSGATLCLKTDDSLLPGPALVEQVREQEVSIVFLTPSALSMLPPEQLSGVRLVTVGGEPFSHELVARWTNCRRFFNFYGPTECTIFATMSECVDGERPTIGRPIFNTDVYVLDRHLSPVPLGVIGELHVGGLGLARGYLDRPELTKERFISHPFSKKPGARLYKTGDLVRYLPDGRLEFLGRADHQIKLRGFRIELGEIESVLAQHPAVKETVVVVREDAPGDTRLVAYVVLSLPDTAPVAELRSFLRERLPEYMVPSVFLLLETLPVLPNGKLNRAGLPVPDAARPEVESTYIAPGSECEETITKVWQEVLRLDKVGIHDNFFDLGGHSLLLVRLHAKLGETLDTPLSVIDLFRYPTIHSLAKHISEGQIQADSFDEAQERAERQKEAVVRRKRRGNWRATVQ